MSDAFTVERNRRGPYEMVEKEIGERLFVDLILTALPQLRDDFHQASGLVHNQMLEFAIMTTEAGKDGDWTTVETCLSLADTLLRQGDETIKNATYVSFLEILPRSGQVHDKLRRMMTNELRNGWDQILAYLSSLDG